MTEMVAYANLFDKKEFNHKSSYRMISENKFEYKTDVTKEGEILISPYV